jgi:hypothetical protein
MLAVVLSLTASAHEHQDIASGQYAVTIGFIEEPAFVGEKNGLFLHVEKAGTPVEGLFGTLQAEVIYGDQRMALPLTPTFGQPGVYQSVFFPMAEGDYTFHIVGQIEGTAIDESFTSSPEGFDSVQSREPLEFPKPSASTGAGTIGGSVLSQTDGDGPMPFASLVGVATLVAVAALWSLQRGVLGRRRGDGVPSCR